MKKRDEFRKITYALKWLYHAIPPLLVLSILGVLIVRYIFKVSPDDTAVAAGVPLVSLFIVRRVALAIMPVPSESEKKLIKKISVPVWFILCSLLLLISFFVGVASLISSGLYYWVGFHNCAVDSLILATVLLYIGITNFIVMVFVRIKLWKLLGLVMIRTARQVFLLIPEIIADHMLIGDWDSVRGACH
jgi:hypothetical protein